MIVLLSIFLVVVRCEETKTTATADVEEQLDPSIYVRHNLFGGGQEFYNNQLPNQISTMSSVNFAFTCKCTSKQPNPSAPPPADATQVAQQQIQQLQDQIRRQQEIINRANQQKTGVEQFTQLMQIASSLECSCQNDENGWRDRSLQPFGVNSMGRGFAMNGYPILSGHYRNAGYRGFPGGQFIDPSSDLQLEYGHLQGVPLTVPFQTRLQPIAT